MWVLIVSVPDRCLSLYFVLVLRQFLRPADVKDSLIICESQIHNEAIVLSPI